MKKCKIWFVEISEKKIVFYNELEKKEKNNSVIVYLSIVSDRTNLWGIPALTEYVEILSRTSRGILLFRGNAWWTIHRLLIHSEDLCAILNWKLKFI